MRHGFRLFILLIFSLCGSTLFAQNVALSKDITSAQITQKRTQYPERIKQLESFRIQHLSKYNAASAKQKKELLIQLKARLETELTEHVFPAWYGTTWDFNGTSNEPGKGKIACGYFVSTTLKHIGYRLNRYKLAQQPSQRIITTFMKRSALDVSSKRSLLDVKKKLMKSGDGIYIIGLDSHVGFVVVQGEKISFVHSSYYTPDSVVIAESYDSKNPLSDSKYRVVGKLFHDEMIINWLNAKTYKVAQ